jgi:hypothetical protein
MISDLQKSRVRFHLGYPNDQITGALLEIQQNLVLGNLSPDTEFALVGEAGDRYLFLGRDLAQVGSLLHKLEVAYSNLSPLVIEDSLFVKSAGSVELRRDELQARRSLYTLLVKDLEVLLDVKIFGKTSSIYHNY